MRRDNMTERVTWRNASAVHAAEDSVRLDDVVREHGRFVYRVTYSVLRNHHDAEDAAQEVFLKVFRLNPNLTDVRDAKLWLAKIAWRVAIDRSRRGPEVPLESDSDEAGLIAMLPAEGASAEEVAAAEQMRELMHPLIASLPEDLRSVLVLSCLDEMNSPDIAELLGIPEGSVRTRLMRARSLLKEKLATILEKRRG
jgi:RNA polymerase sigma-70 factor (ECF subfamily)